MGALNNDVEGSVALDSSMQSMLCTIVFLLYRGLGLEKKVEMFYGNSKVS